MDLNTMSLSPSVNISTQDITERRSPTMNRLLKMLTYMRPAWSNAERKFIKRFIKDPLGNLAQQDCFGNIFVSLPNADGSAPFIAWSCHTDTVHNNGGRQDVALDDLGFVYAVNSDCLGADDTAGVWLMLEMIRANVPGLYIFHRAEEIGGRGSSHIVKHSPELVSGIDAMIALDRAGSNSIITHQGGSRCASGAFAASLKLSMSTMAYDADDTGTFTDSANYTDLIGECSNLSVGYHRAHSSSENLDTAFLFQLRDALIALDQYALVFSRQPGDIDPDDFSGYARLMGSRMDWTEAYNDNANDENGEFLFAPREDKRRELLTMVMEHPSAVTTMLEDLGIGADDLRAYIWGTH